MKFQSNLKNLAYFFIFWENMAKYLLTYVTKRMADVILKTISIKHKIVSIRKHLPTMVQASKTLYCYQFSADFTYFMSVARELFLHSRLISRENGPIGPRKLRYLGLGKAIVPFCSALFPKVER